jgi:hypothetical protein
MTVSPCSSLARSTTRSRRSDIRPLRGRDLGRHIVGNAEGLHPGHDRLLGERAVFDLRQHPIAWSEARYVASDATDDAREILSRSERSWRKDLLLAGDDKQIGKVMLAALTETTICLGPARRSGTRSTRMFYGFAVLPHAIGAHHIRFQWTLGPRLQPIGDGGRENLLRLAPDKHPHVPSRKRELRVIATLH